MIIISSSLTLVEGDPTLDPDLPLIGWHNLVDINNIVADTEDEDFPAVNLANPATFLKWKGTLIGESPAADHQYLTVETNYIDDIDYLAVVGHNFGSAAIAVSVEGRTSALGDWFELVSPSMLADDNPVLFRFEPQSLQAIRLKMEDGTEPPEAAVLYVGKLLVMERGLHIDDDFTPITFGRTTNVVSGTSESGNFLGRIVLGELNNAEVHFKWLTPSWYRTYFEPFALVAPEQPFFFVWSPDDYPFEVGYCWAIENPVPMIDPVTQRVHVDLRMSGIA